MHTREVLYRKFNFNLFNQHNKLQALPNLFINFVLSKIRCTLDFLPQYKHILTVLPQQKGISLVKLVNKTRAQLTHSLENLSLIRMQRKHSDYAMYILPFSLSFRRRKWTGCSGYATCLQYKPHLNTHIAYYNSIQPLFDMYRYCCIEQYKFICHFPGVGIQVYTFVCK